MPAKCRNGHDLSKHGKWEQTTCRPLHVRCQECKRISRKRNLDDRKAARDAARKASGMEGKCRNGHDRSHSTWYVPKDPKKAYWRCRICDKEHHEKAKQNR